MRNPYCIIHPYANSIKNYQTLDWKTEYSSYISFCEHLANLEFIIYLDNGYWKIDTESGNSRINIFKGITSVSQAQVECELFRVEKIKKMHIREGLVD